MSVQNYIGNELELFEHANHWKNYWGSFVRPYLKGDVLEVGSGIGGTTKLLCDGSQNSWTCLEPDPKLHEKTVLLKKEGVLPAICQAHCATLSEMEKTKLFDCIIYIDVIEHIENDQAELERAYSHLKIGGHLVILVPAHQYLYSPFDKAIGHFRRYNKSMLKAVVPTELMLQKLYYLDSVGFAASLANKMLLSQSYPTLKQIKLWNNLMVPISKISDTILGFSFGKSVLGVWEKR